MYGEPIRALEWRLFWQISSVQTDSTLRQSKQALALNYSGQTFFFNQSPALTKRPGRNNSVIHLEIACRHFSPKVHSTGMRYKCCQIQNLSAAIAMPQFRPSGDTRLAIIATAAENKSAVAMSVPTAVAQRSLIPMAQDSRHRRWEILLHMSPLISLLYMKRHGALQAKTVSQLQSFSAGSY